MVMMVMEVAAAAGAVIMVVVTVVFDEDASSCVIFFYLDYRWILRPGWKEVHRFVSKPTVNYGNVLGKQAQPLES